jgi:hypothetical protein
MNDTDRKFYVYAWLRPDGTPFYIGKGCGRRAWIQNCHLQKVPSGHLVRILASDLSDAEAIEWEMALIAILGRKDLGTGCLRNLTDGGEGRMGFKTSEETKKKISTSNKGKLLGRKQDQIHKTRRAEARKQRLRWQHDVFGDRYCSASDLISEFGNLSRAGLSRIKTGVYQEYKGWRLT